ncbi:MAG: hypothetical protein V4543_00745 [Bacteroidota bacterium]
MVKGRENIPKGDFSFHSGYEPKHSPAALYAQESRLRKLLQVWLSSQSATQIKELLKLTPFESLKPKQAAELYLYNIPADELPGLLKLAEEGSLPEALVMLRQISFNRKKANGSKRRTQGKIRSGVQCAVPDSGEQKPETEHQR